MTEESGKNLVLGNRYRLLHQVGKGGMALVYEAHDQLLERSVAVKLLRQSFSSDPAFQERFRQEAKAAANLSHPNIVTIYDFGFDPAGLYMVMEFLPGKDLKTKIQEYGRFSEHLALPLMIQACAGLGYAHRAGIVHCDVKPHNMLISRDQRLKITDFGIARALSTVNVEQNPDVIWGSPLYFSPEQTLGEVPSPSSDVYSLGVVMFEMLTGRLPFEADTVDALIKLHQSQNPIDPRELNPDISSGMASVILKVLAKEPTARYRSADQLGRVMLLIAEKTDAISTSPPPYVPAKMDNLEQPPGFGVIESDIYVHKESRNPTDWKLIGLELLALLLVGGLIPFWLFVGLKLSTSFR